MARFNAKVAMISGPSFCGVIFIIHSIHSFATYSFAVISNSIHDFFYKKECALEELEEYLASTDITSFNYCLKGSRVNWLLQKDRDGDNLLHKVTTSNNTEFLRPLLTNIARFSDPQDIDMRNSQGLAAVHIATINGSKHFLEALSNAGADLRAEIDWLSPVFLAIDNEHLNIVQYFIEQLNLSVNFQNSQGNTLLYHAALMQQEKIVEYLLNQKHVYLNITNLEYETVLDLDLSDGNKNINDMLEYYATHSTLKVMPQNIDNSYEQVVDKDNTAFIKEDPIDYSFFYAVTQCPETDFASTENTAFNSENVEEVEEVNIIGHQDHQMG